MLRLTFYIVTGIMTALLGWSWSHIVIYFLESIAEVPGWNILSQLRQWPQIVLIPLITVCLAVGMVLIEIFISNPTRPGLNLKIALKPLLLTIIIGLLVGIIVGGILEFVYHPSWGLGGKTVRVFTWWTIGITISFIESLAWKFHSMEAGDSRIRRMRQLTSLFGATLSSLIAVGIFEWVRNSLDIIPQEFQYLEELLGFCI